MLLDYQFEIDGFVFGRDADIKLDGEDAFDPGIANLDTQDASLEQEDARRFGTDRLRGPTWSWQLFTDRETPEQALASLGALATVWRDESVRTSPGAFSTLRYAVGGRTRRVYGRPRRLSAPPENRILGGLIPITVDFTCVDALHYDDEASQTTMQLTASTAGGFTVPFTAPLTTASLTGSREARITVGGDAQTWATVTFHGPVTNPTLELPGGWKVGLRMTLGEDESVTIDPRPWARTVTRADGSSVGGALTRESRLAQMRLTPGQHAFLYRGIDVTGTSRATVAWRNANHSL